MKICKKIALMMILFILSATLNVYAATVGVTLNSSSETVKVGDTVAITFVANSENGIGGIDGILNYDSTKLEMLTEEGKAAASGFMDCSGIDDVSGEYKLSVLYNGDETGAVALEFAIIEFKVLDTVSVDEVLTIKLSGIEAGDSNEDWQAIEDVQIELKVVEEEPIPDDPTPDDPTPDDPTPDDPTPDDPTPDDPTPDDPTPDDPTPDDPTPDDPTPDDPTPDDPNEDNTIADKDFNYAGKAYMYIIIFVVAIIAIGIYGKINQYKDIK